MFPVCVLKNPYILKSGLSVCETSKLQRCPESLKGKRCKKKKSLPDLKTGPSPVDISVIYQLE